MSTSIAKRVNGDRLVESVAPEEVVDWVRSLLERGGRIERLAGGFKACCPAHEDRTPSLSVKPGRVRVMLHCFAGCSEEAVCQALGITIQDLFYEHYRKDSPSPRKAPRASVSASEAVSRVVEASPVREDDSSRFDGMKAYKSLAFPGLGKPTRVYEYTDEQGTVLFAVGRYETTTGKSFRQFSPSLDGGWYRKGPSDEAKVLYRLPQLRHGIEAGAVVALVEGEKDALTGSEQESYQDELVVFTSAAGGAKAHWLPQFTEQLRGARLVRIIADRDEPGREHAWQVAAALEKSGIPHEVVESDRAKDWTDHVEQGGTMSDLVASTPPPPPPPVEPPAASFNADDSGPWRVPRYFIESGCLWRESIENVGKHPRLRRSRLLDRDVRMTGRIRSMVSDDWDDDPKLARIGAYRVVAQDPAGGEPLEMELDAKEYRDGSWLDELGGADFRRDRSGRAEVMRGIEAVSRLAPTVRVRASMGWTVIDGQRAYVHGGGAITAQGVLDVPVKLPPDMGAWRLEPPSEQPGEDVAESIGLLWSAAEWMPPRVWVTLAGTVYRSILPDNRLITMMVAPPGAGKTEVSMVAAQHFAPKMSHTHRCYVSMGSSGTTVKAAQVTQHRAKDAMLLIDDFPARTLREKAESAQEMMIRGVYNRESRTTLTHDRQQVPGPYARCSVISSAEYAPDNGNGARERCLVVPMPWGNRPPVPMISAAQAPARAQARSRFLAWLIQATAATDAEALEELIGAWDLWWQGQLIERGYGTRTSEHVGRLLTGWQWAIEQLTAAKVWDQQRADAVMGQVWAAALEAADSDSDPDRDVSTAAALIRLIGKVLSGRGYVADAARQDQPPQSMDALDCGWSSIPSGQDTRWVSQGRRLGWVRGDRVFLDPAAVLSTAQMAASDEGIHLGVYSVASASAMLVEAQIGMVCGNGKRSHAVKIGGRVERVWDLPVSLFWGGDPDDEVLDAAPRPPSPSAPVSQTPQEPSPSQGEKPTCAVCREPMIPIAGADRHPNCDDRPPAASVLASKQASTESSSSSVASATRWRAAEVILTADEAILPDGTRLPLPDVSHLGDLARWAAMQRIGSGGGKDRPEPGRVWLARDWLEAHGLPVRDQKAITEGRLIEAEEKLAKSLAKAWETHSFFVGAAEAGYETGKTAMSGWTRVWRRGSKDSAVVTSPEWVSTTALTKGDIDSEHLIRRLGLWTHTTGSPLIIQEGVTFKSMCRLNAIDLPALPWAAMAADFMWQREATETDLARGYVHCYDRRKSYLAACASAEASDTLEYVTHPVIDPKRPGFWHISACDWPELGYPLPDPRLDYEENICDWVPTPALALLAEHCHTLEVDEAWLYTGKTSRVCEHAYETTKRALDVAEGWDQSDADVVAVIAALKASYRTGIGQMAQIKDEGTRKRGHRPDVRATIIATHRANSIRAMLWAGEHGEWPLAMARADSVLFASDDPDAVSGWPGRDDGMSARLGKYKSAGTQTMSEWVRLALPEPISASRSIWAVTDPEKAETALEGDSAFTYSDPDGVIWEVANG
jgi:hypothetical protein